MAPLPSNAQTDLTESVRHSELRRQRKLRGLIAVRRVHVDRSALQLYSYPGTMPVPGWRAAIKAARR